VNELHFIVSTATVHYSEQLLVFLIKS